MAASIATAKASSHSRSISLPSRTHPLTATVEEHLCRLRTPESLKCSKLAALRDLYESVDNFLQMPTTQQNLSISGEDVLCESLRLLDLCSTTKDAFYQIRASVQDLESSLRRREADVASKVESYLICKKKANKMASKRFASVEKLKNHKNNKNSAILSLLIDVEEVSITIFKSLISSVCPAKTTSNHKWTLLFNTTQSKKVHCEGGNEDEFNHVQKMDMALQALNKKSSKHIDMQEVQKCLMGLDLKMREPEEELDRLFRSLIKTRASLLNVLNH